MDGLEYLGVETATLKKNAPYIGGGIGALVGALAMLGWSAWPSLSRGRFALNFKRGTMLPSLAGASAVGAAVGGGVGYAIKKRV